MSTVSDTTGQRIGRADRTMNGERSTAPTPRQRRVGAAITGFVGLFLLFDAVARIVRFGPYVEGTVQFGYAAEQATLIGLALLIPTLLYLIPRTAVLGAVLVTGYLGGAVASHIRVADGGFAFAAAMGVLAWIGLALREPRLRDLLPLRSRP